MVGVKMMWVIQKNRGAIMKYALRMPKVDGNI